MGVSGTSNFQLAHNNEFRGNDALLLSGPVTGDVREPLEQSWLLNLLTYNEHRSAAKGLKDIH